MTTHSDKKDKLVNIKIAELVFQVQAGVHLVAELKKLAGLSPNDNLEQLVNGRIKPLDDNGKVEIHGDESFVVCGTGAAS